MKTALKKTAYSISAIIIMALNIIILSFKPAKAEEAAAYKYNSGTGCPVVCNSGMTDPDLCNIWVECVTQGTDCSQYMACKCLILNVW